MCSLHSPRGPVRNADSGSHSSQDCESAARGPEGALSLCFWNMPSNKPLGHSDQVLGRPHFGKRSTELGPFPDTNLMVSSLLPWLPAPARYNVMVAVPWPVSTVTATHRWLTSMSVALPLHSHLLPPGMPIPASSLANSYSSLKDEAQMNPFWESSLTPKVSFLSSALPYHPAINSLFHFI